MTGDREIFHGPGGTGRLNIGVRASNSLLWQDPKILTINELSTYSARELLGRKALGVITVGEILAAMNEAGYHLKNEDLTPASVRRAACRYRDMFATPLEVSSA
jgi:hypothetical protein